MLSHMDRETAIASLAAELRGERAATRMSIRALSEASGIPEVSLNRYLAGKRDIPGSALLSLGEALGVDPGILLNRAVQRAQGEQS